MITVYCPVCGQKLFEGEECSDIRVKCRRCGYIIRTDIEIAEEQINIKNSILSAGSDEKNFKKLSKNP